jgi:SAM-dependent methyltransferase
MSDLDFKARELQGIYSQRFDQQVLYRNAIWRELIRCFFQRFVPAGAAVLDLGCGYGEFINNVPAGRKYAMDLNPSAANRLNPEVQLLQQDCSDPWPLPDGTLDVIFTSNFFEHLPDKATLRRTLHEAHRCLREGGLLIALGPNIRMVSGAYWDFWDHYLCLTDRSLAEGMRNNGYRIHTQIAAFLPYTMSSGPHYPLWTVRAYLSLPLLWRIFGRQFLVIGQKLAA